MRSASLLILLTAVLSTVHAADIDMTGTPDVNREDFVMGVQIDHMYYTVIISEGQVAKVELDGSEEVDFTISTTFEKVIDFVNNYSTMSWLDKMKFLVIDLKLPLSYVINLDLNNG